MKIFVTGGAGYIGGTVAALFAEKGHKAVIFDNLSHGRRELLPPGMEFIEGELADRPALEAIFENARKQSQPFDAVLHFAALIEAGESMVQPELFFRNNTASLFRCLRPCWPADPGAWFFLPPRPSTASRNPFLSKKMRVWRPTNPYGQSKLLVEQMLTWFNRIHGLRYASLRYFNVAGAPEGPDGVTRGEAHDPETHLIPLVLDVALGRRPSIRIYGNDYPTPDGTCIRDYIHVSDLADAHLLALAALGQTQTSLRKNDPAPKISPLIYNLGNGQGFSVQEVIESARRVTGHPIPAEIHPGVPATPPCSSPAQKKPSANWAGSRAIPRSMTSSALPGPGIRSGTSA